MLFFLLRGIDTPNEVLCVDDKFHPLSEGTHQPKHLTEKELDEKHSAEAMSFIIDDMANLLGQGEQPTRYKYFKVPTK